MVIAGSTAGVVIGLATVRYLEALLFHVKCSGPQRLLLSFPTRRSSDLLRPWSRSLPITKIERPIASKRGRRLPAQNRRSEEHTSELQSPVQIVCRLLLEKKKPVSWPLALKRATSSST